MLKQVAYFSAFFIFFAGAFVLSERFVSPVFQSCIEQDKNTDTKATAEKNPSTFGAAISSYVRCSGEFIEDHEGGITALATIIIAAFTGTLWMATSGLLSSAIDQSRHMEIVAKAAKKSAKVAAKSLRVANRPVIAISPLELCEANEFQAAPHIHFGLTNSGKGVAIVNKVAATVQITPRGGNVLTLTTISRFIPSDAPGEIEPGQPMSGYPIVRDSLDAQELQQIKSGEKTLRIIFHITFKSTFDTIYTPELSFDFDHKLGVFIPRSRLIPEKEQ